MDSITEIQNDIASTQATIDQARAHLEAHKHLMPEAYVQSAHAKLDDRQHKLDTAKAFVNFTLESA